MVNIIVHVSSIMKKRRRMNYPLHTCIKILSFSYLVSTASIILLLLTKHQNVTEALALSSSNTLTYTRNDRKWIENFDNLVDYRKVHGTFRVDKDVFPSLGRWAMRQRGFHRRGELREDRVKLLEGISFFEEYDADAYAKRRSPDSGEEGENFVITLGMVILWTVGGLAHSIFDFSVWHFMAW